MTPASRESEGYVESILTKRRFGNKMAISRQMERKKYDEDGNIFIDSQKHVAA